MRWLGGGQFGDVYLAQDTILGMDFALKVSRMRPSDIQMIKDEARTLASLNHPNIVRFYSVDQIEGQFVLVTEYVPGSSLRERLDRGHLEVSESVRITAGILKALAWAHEREVIHRDLKPENILLTEEGEVKVADFGLARFLKKDSLAASVAGTPFYMSPEAWAGRFLFASDLWSVGVMLYEMLTGVLPFTGANFEEIRTTLLTGEAVDPQRLGRDLPKDLCSVVLSLLRKDPEARPRGASVVLQQLVPKGHTPALSAKPTVESQLEEDITLTAEQRDIVESFANRQLLVGAAGTGKTSLIVYRTRYLLAHGASSDKLLLLAFSRRAADEMRRRLERLSGRSLPDMWIETFHSLGWKFLRMEGWRLDLSAEFVVVDSGEIIRRLSRKWGANRAKALAERLLLLRHEVESIEDFHPETPADDQLAEFWQDYSEEQRELQALDFEDLILKFLRLLEDEDLRDRWRSHFSHILVDELQDLSPAQFKLLRLLAGPDTGLFLTGDVTQSIYAWRGADPLNIKAAEGAFQPILRSQLNASFRVGSEMVKIASNLMAHSADAWSVPSVSLAQHPGNFEFYKAQGVADEARFVAARISSLMEEGYRPSDFGVLYRINSYSRAFEEALASHRIPASVIGAQPFYERTEVRHFLEMMSAVRKRSLELSIPSWQWLLSLKSETNPLAVEGSILKLSSEAKTRSRKSLENFFENLSEWCSRLDEVRPVDLLEFMAKSKVSARCLASRSAGQAFEELREAASRFHKGELGLFLDHVALLEDLELAAWSLDRVRLLSIHSAKGLEFKVVFLVGVIEGLIPLTSSLATDQGLEEERRLCYVAITRSKERCYVSMPARRFQETTRPSRFLLQMLGLL